MKKLITLVTLSAALFFSLSAYADGEIETYTFANGNKYVGQFKDDKRHGEGTYHFPGGIKNVFNYVNGEVRPLHK